MQTTHYDVIIVGGAMAGVTLALALSSQTQGQLRIAILEKQALNQHQQSGFDARCIALSDGSCQRFAQIRLPNGTNLWQQIQPISTPIQKIHVSDRGHSGLAEFTASEFQLDQLGAVIELAPVGKILLEACQAYENIDYLAPVTIQHIEVNAEQVKISLENDRTLTASLLVGADGTQSAVAKSVNIAQPKVREYGQTAIITNVQVQQPHQYRAFERFTAQGPVALLPMANNLMSLVWCVKDPEPLLQLNEQDFLRALQQQFGWRLGKLQACGQRASYPLNLYCAEQHIASRVALVGNAAQTLHPIAGQGFNLGIRDVMRLAEQVATAFLQHKDIASDELLQQYQQHRRQDQQKIIALTDGLLSIFANDLLPLQIGRSLGLMVLAQSHFLRQQFAKPTLGWV